MKYPIFTFIALNTHKSLYSSYNHGSSNDSYNPEYNYSYDQHDSKHIDFRETWQNSILSGIIKPFRNKVFISEIENPVNYTECNSKVGEIIKAKTNRLKSSVQKKFIRQIISVITGDNRSFISLNTISSTNLDDELSNALIWFSNKYESFFNPNSLSNELERSKIDINCTFEDIGIRNVKIKELANNPTFAQKLHIPKVINYLKSKSEIFNTSKWLSTEELEDNSIGLFYHSSNGSGKTYSYLLSVLESGCKNTAIIVPTRELAVQIFKIAKSIIPDNVNPYLLIGGANIKHQIEKLKSLDNDKFNIFVATPGRFIDLTSRKVLSMRHISNIVFDEYDSYFSLPKNSNNLSVKESFLSIIKTIYNLKSDLPGAINLHGKKVIFCSAIDRQEQVHNLLKIEDVKKSNMNGVQSDCITHFLVTYGEGKDKVGLLKRLLEIKSFGKSVLIFVNCQEHIEFLSKVIKDYMPNVNLISLSASDDKMDRQKSFDELQKLKSNDYEDSIGPISSICVTTDISSRGIDFSPFTFLINYSIPGDIITYNNRCGRLNFSDKRGVCITLCQGSQIPKFGRTVLKRLSVPIHPVDPIQGILFKKRNQYLPYVTRS
ncbi:Eukaryotic initiation factor 4A [Babesia microti strain RI]|uniref:ATP-dependent RNA helicase n=1 Tax=Babesia microti (strain RI) TaxID=1133968 RepID=A0A1R4AA05_BABMR|nr:Eukaryotic initiation factor 4A [Babesia microti strain RI]SJK85814.1 Eukaryotic initiation factor 4A [Babesia microti strain RI]|eukprot:XP_021338033.1 Eukaryotic initiation factor 4A [Babesia microti strain RI]